MIQQDASGRFAEQDRLGRFLEKVIPEPMSGCWLWLGHLNADGYGTFRWSKERGTRAHVAAWELFRGERQGLDVLHKCDVRCCANPDHLYLGTQVENTLDAVHRGRWVRPPRPAPEQIPRGAQHWTRRAPERVRPRGSSGFRGIAWDKTRSKWHVQIKSPAGAENLGRFTDVIEAACAYNVAARRLFGTSARLNRMDGAELHPVFDVRLAQ